MLTGYVRGQELRISTPELAADSIKYLEAEFHFAGRDWDGYTKTAYFINGTSKFALVLADDCITADMGLNLTAGEWEVKLSGVKGGSRITTTTEHIYVREFGSTDGTLPDVTATQAEQILAKIGDLSDLTTEDKTNLVAAINEAAKSGGSGSVGKDGTGIESITYKSEDEDGGNVYTVLLTDGTSYEITAPKGSTGAKGDKGDTGSPGSDGVTPTIGDNGNWYIGSTDTGKPSRGAAGAPGAKGDKGDDYVLTEADKTEIAGDIIEDGVEVTLGDDPAADNTLGITGATVGQIAKITAVDESGKPTAWEPVDMPGGGGGWALHKKIKLTERVNQIEMTLPDNIREIFLRVYEEDDNTKMFVTETGEAVPKGGKMYVSFGTALRDEETAICVIEMPADGTNYRGAASHVEIIDRGSKLYRALCWLYYRRDGGTAQIPHALSTNDSKKESIDLTKLVFSAWSSTAFFNVGVVVEVLTK